MTLKQASRFLIGLSASRGIELPEGVLISPGAPTGAHDVRVGSSARVDFGISGDFDDARFTGSTARVNFGSFGSFEVKFEPVAPKQ